MKTPAAGRGGKHAAPTPAAASHASMPLARSRSRPDVTADRASTPSHMQTPCPPEDDSPKARPGTTSSPLYRDSTTLNGDNQSWQMN